MDVLFTLKILSAAGLAGAAGVLLWFVFSKSPHTRWGPALLCARCAVILISAFFTLQVFRIVTGAVLAVSAIWAWYVVIWIFHSDDGFCEWNPLPDCIYCFIWLVTLILSFVLPIL